MRQQIVLCTGGMSFTQGTANVEIDDGLVRRVMSRYGLKAKPLRAALRLAVPDVVILVDSSAWIAYLRVTGSRVDRYLRALLRDGRPLASAGIVILEILAGARDEVHADCALCPLRVVDPAT